MIGSILCLISFVLCYLVGRRSLVSGLTALLGVGYLYGITRANVPDTFSHFIFDTGVLGLYCAQLFRSLSPAQEQRLKYLKPWVEVLIVWPVIIFLIPLQDLLVQFVGLRGNVFLLPFLLIGARLEPGERYQLALNIAGLNLIALAFAGAEFFYGVPTFFPFNEVTKIIYLSRDVGGNSAFRIPACFGNAHSYAGTMVMTIPFLAGALVQKHKREWQGKLLMIAIGASLLGVLLSAARLHFIVAAVLIIVGTFSLRSSYGSVLGLLTMLVGIGYLVSGEERLQRFMILQNTDMVAERVTASVNMTFYELATRYPFGNGLGGGGTSIPYFLRDRIENPIGMENEYARIMLEQGVIGLVIWVAFIFWLLTRRGPSKSDPWLLGWRLAWVACASYFLTGLMGIGLLTSVPQTCLLLLSVGWISSPSAYQERKSLVNPSLREGKIEALDVNAADSPTPSI